MSYKYNYVKCNCGGIIGQKDKRIGFECDNCHKTYELSDLDYTRLFINDMTDWIFPMKLIEEK